MYLDRRIRLGVVLWQMVTGMKPYSTETLSAFQLQLKIVNEPLPLTGTNWDNLIQKATEKDSQHRYADINSFRSAWQKGQNVSNERSDGGDKTVIEQQPKQPIPKIPQKPTIPPRKRSFVVPNLILLMLMVAGYFFWKGNDSTQKVEVEAAILETEIEPVISSVKIGDQEWQSKNLDVDRFRNGDLIPHATTAEEWKAAGERGEPAWCYYDNDTEKGRIYGKLYNWYAVNDARGLAPTGWHIPTDEEWTTLTNYLGGEAGGKMKATGTAYWNSPNTDANNDSGFSVLPGGCRYDGGSFDKVRDGAFFWSAAEVDGSYAWGRGLDLLNGYVSMSNLSKSFGASVRCLRD